MLSFRTVPHCLVPIPRNSPVHAQTTQLMISRTQQQQKAAKACPSRHNGDWTPWTPCIFWQSSFRWNISSVALKETERVSVTNFDRVLESLSLDDVGPCSKLNEQIVRIVSHQTPPHDFWRLQVKLLRTVSNFNMDRKSWCPMPRPWQQEVGHQNQKRWHSILTGACFPTHHRGIVQQSTETALPCRWNSKQTKRFENRNVWNNSTLLPPHVCGKLRA